MPIELDPGALGMRERLSHADFLVNARASAPDGFRMRTHADFEGTLERIMRSHRPGDPLHVFAYGSLMWNPALVHDAQFRARIHGWHRSFCIRSFVGRGTPECPGLMLALDKGGSCNGMLLRIPASNVSEEVALLWRREMTWGTYDARWTTALVDAVPMRALVFIVDRRHERYVGRLPVQETARLINCGRGALGTSREYFDATLRKLGELGIRDVAMERLHDAVHIGTLAR
ncbi:MAG: gamma-glutamylcyclotransferase [Variovorax sp.]|nr:gamma-glutamylcyclotransferase [Variovorax sp.]